MIAKALSEKGKTWEGRWNAKLTILLHYQPGGRASVKEKEEEDKGETGRDLQEDVGLQEDCDVPAI